MRKTESGEFVLVSIERSPALTRARGCEWMHYTIAQGANVIDGHRRGSGAVVRAYVETVVQALNERLALRRARPAFVSGHGANRGGGIDRP